MSENYRILLIWRRVKKKKKRKKIAFTIVPEQLLVVQKLMKYVDILAN